MFYLSEVNMKRIIYADNAATTRIDPAVLETMAPLRKKSMRMRLNHTPSLVKQKLQLKTPGKK